MLKKSMLKSIDDKTFLKIAIVAGIFIIIFSFLPSFGVSVDLIGRILGLFIFYGFIIIGKREKNIFLTIIAYLLVVWNIIYIIARFGLNFSLGGGVALDWLLYLFFGLILFKIKKIGIIPKITSIYIVMLSLVILLIEESLAVFLGIYWLLLMIIVNILLIITLYQYLRTMKRRRRRRRK